MVIDLGWILTAVLEFSVPLLELIAALVILAGGVWALALLVRLRSAAHARHQFTQALLLGLDFTIGADMLRLAAAPDIAAAVLAAGVTAVRIALTLTLLREVRPVVKQPQ